MIKKSKKIISIILSIILVISCFTVLVFTVNAATTNNGVQAASGGLVVTASSNLAESVINTYSENDNTVNIKLNFSAQKRIANGEYKIQYDTTKLKLKGSSAGDDYSPFTPAITSGGMINTNEAGMITGNFSGSSTPYNFSQEKVLFDLTFDIIGTGETTVDFTMLEMDYMDTSTYDTTMMVFGGQVLDTFRETAQARFTMSEPSVVPTETQPTETVPTETANPTESVPTTPTESDPTTPTESDPTNPTESEPTNPTESEPTNPTESEPTNPTESEPTNPTETDPEILLGDVDFDGDINVKDATFIQLHAARLYTLTEKQLANADVDHDNDVNVKDATYIQLFAAHFIESFSSSSY